MNQAAVIAQNVERAKQIPGLRGLAAWWLTFCIAGPTIALERIVTALAEEAGVNLEGAESGFLNAKLRTPAEPEQIVDAVLRVHRLASASGATLVAVDADSSADVEVSTCFALWLPE